MNILINRYLITLAAAALLAGCDPKFSESVEDFEPSAGDADFSTFVTVGDSLTAGYKDGALYRDGQKDSFPAILANQFAEVGGGSFRQPLRMPEATGSYIGVPTMGAGGIADRLVLIANDDPPVTPAPIDPSVPTAILPALTGLFNNFGVPGAKSINLGFVNYGDPARLGIDANPHYVRFASAPGATILGDAVARAPTFFILWIGNNDILLNAIAGSPGAANPTLGVGLSDVTPTATFTGAFNAAVAALTAASPGNKGILVNIPDVSTIPFFTTVPFDAIPLEQGDVDMLAPLAAGYNAVLDGVAGGPISQAQADRRRISFEVGQNPILIIDENLTDLTAFLPAPLVGLAQARQATRQDLILLTASSKLGEDAGGGALWGITAPLLDTDVLKRSEVNALEAIRQAYNATIEAAAAADDDLLLLDAAALLEELNESGISYGSGGISSAFIQGGGVSLDGVHPTARGYAVVANEIIELINDGFNANIAPVDPNRFSTVFYQQ